MGLWLPRSVTKAQKCSINSNSIIGHFHTLSEFTGKLTSVSDLVRHLGTMRRSEVIRIVANMAATICSEHGMKHLYQMQMAQHILPNEIWQLVRAKLPYSDQHPGRLFIRRQVWFLLQMAIISCSESAPAMDPVEVQKRVGHAALM